MAQLSMVATETSFVTWTKKTGKDNKVNVMYTETTPADEETETG